MQEWFARWGLLELSGLTVTVRLLLAAVCGGVLGLERTRKRRAAGLRTYMLVCIGAALVMLTSQYLADFFHTGDVGRMPAQVVSGIGFLGVGTILVTRQYRVKGLTTAAGLWAAAGVGLAIGIGFYTGALICCALLLVIMLFADRFEAAFTRRLRRVPLYVAFERVEAVRPFLALLRSEGITAANLELMPLDGRQGVALFCQLRFPPSSTRAEAISLVARAEGVVFFEEVDD